MCILAQVAVTRRSGLIIDITILEHIIRVGRHMTVNLFYASCSRTREPLLTHSDREWISLKVNENILILTQIIKEIFKEPPPISTLFSFTNEMRDKILAS